ncbi:hypothetical protein LXA43DRAFT_900295 [Ganoderma leucocontextum]|nr:hypothetical protein LXA43DRAFT_900295 [Ganoderma leucocontextum]
MARCTKPLSNDLRWSIVHMRYMRKMSTQEIHHCTGVQPRSIQRVVKLFNTTATVAPRVARHAQEKVLTPGNMKFSEACLEHSPDAYLDELKVQLEEVCGKKVSKSTVWRALMQMGFTLKKVRA